MKSCGARGESYITEEMEGSHTLGVEEEKKGRFCKHLLTRSGQSPSGTETLFRFLLEKVNVLKI